MPLLAGDAAQQLWRGLVLSAWALPLHLATAVVAVAAFLALAARRYAVARAAAVAQATLIFWDWPVSQYPYLVPPDLTIAGAAAPQITLELVLGALTLGGVVLIPSLFYLFRVFKFAAADAPRGR